MTTKRTVGMCALLMASSGCCTDRVAPAQIFLESDTFAVLAVEETDSGWRLLQWASPVYGGWGLPFPEVTQLELLEGAGPHTDDLIFRRPFEFPESDRLWVLSRDLTRTWWLHGPIASGKVEIIGTVKDWPRREVSATFLDRLGVRIGRDRIDWNLRDRVLQSTESDESAIPDLYDRSLREKFRSQLALAEASLSRAHSAYAVAAESARCLDLVENFAYSSRFLTRKEVDLIDRAFESCRDTESTGAIRARAFAAISTELRNRSLSPR